MDNHLKYSEPVWKMGETEVRKILSYFNGYKWIDPPFKQVWAQLRNGTDTGHCATKKEGIRQLKEWNIENCTCETIFNGDFCTHGIFRDKEIYFKNVTT